MNLELLSNFIDIVIFWSGVLIVSVGVCTAIDAVRGDKK